MKINETNPSEFKLCRAMRSILEFKKTCTNCDQVCVFRSLVNENIVRLKVSPVKGYMMEHEVHQRS